MTIVCMLNCEACFWIRHLYSCSMSYWKTEIDFFTLFLCPSPTILCSLLAAVCLQECDRPTPVIRSFTQWGRKDQTAHRTHTCCWGMKTDDKCPSVRRSCLSLSGEDRSEAQTLWKKSEQQWSDFWPAPLAYADRLIICKSDNSANMEKNLLNATCTYICTEMQPDNDWKSGTVFTGFMDQ